MFRKVDLFPSSGEGMKNPTLLGPLETDNLNHGWWTKSTNPVILSVIHHHQNAIQSSNYLVGFLKTWHLCDEITDHPASVIHFYTSTMKNKKLIMRISYTHWTSAITDRKRGHTEQFGIHSLHCKEVVWRKIKLMLLNLMIFQCKRI
jgi:hypothetical protein